MSQSINPDDLVATQEETVKDGTTSSTQTFIAPRINPDDLSLVPPEQIQKQTQARIAIDPAKPPVFGIFGMLPRIAYDLGSVDYHISEPVSLEKQRENHISLISNATGFPKEDVAKHYDAIKPFLYMSPAISMIEGVSANIPLPSAVTTQGLVQATMTPAILAAAAADPLNTMAGLTVFTALDHILPTPQVKDASPDEQATINLVGMIAKGALTGGLIKGSEYYLDKATNPFPEDMLKDLKMGDILEKYTYEKLKDQGLPDVITLAPEKVGELAQMDAENKRIRRQSMSQQKIVDDVSNKLMNNEDVGSMNIHPDFLLDIKQYVVDTINMKEADGQKLTNREKQVRFDLQQELNSQPDPNSILGTLGVTQKEVDASVNNGLDIKVKAEKFVIAAVNSKDVMTGLDPIVGTGESKERGLSLGVEAKAIQEKLTKGFGDLPEYQTVKMDEQAKLANQLIRSDPEQARRIAMGEEKSPEGLIPEAVFVAIENKAIAEGDANTLRDLATSSKLTTEATTMGQRIRTLAERDPESPTAAIKDVIRAREEAAQKKLGKTPIEKEKISIAKEIKKEIKKTRITKDSWASFIKELEC